MSDGTENTTLGRWIQKGYPEAWFTWLERIGVTAALIVVGNRAEGAPAKFLIQLFIAVSVAWIYITTVLPCVKFFFDHLPIPREEPKNRLLKILIVFLIAIVFLFINAVVILALSITFESLIPTG